MVKDTTLGAFEFMHLRPLMQAFLLTTFIIFFGLSAIARHQAKRVVVLMSQKETGGIGPPLATSLEELLVFILASLS